MKLKTTRSRLLLCGVILLAFFIPAYDGLSGVTFISHALSEAETHQEITKADVFVAIIPLLLVPISAIGVFIRTFFLRLSVPTIYLALPLLFTAAFLSVLFITAGSESNSFASPKVFLEMQVGFYIHLVASCLLILTKKQRKRKPRLKSYHVEKTVVA